MNLNDLIAGLDDNGDQTPVVFVTEDGAVGAGYHVTELKHAEITGIDCAARVTTWVETTMQLLDGEGRSHMTLGKLRGILRQSASAVPGLADAPLRVEFAHGNTGMSMFEVVLPEVHDDCVMIRLVANHAVCKPAFGWSGVRGLAKANTQAKTSGGCCT
mgnify:CR=1 FL=1